MHKNVLRQRIEMTTCSTFETIPLLHDMKSSFHRSGGRLTEITEELQLHKTAVKSLGASEN